MSTPNFQKKDFTLTFESEGTKFLFEDLVYTHYMADQKRHSLALWRRGHMREYTNNETLARMDKEGTSRSAEQTHKVISVLDDDIAQAAQLLDIFKNKICSIGDITSAFALLAKIMREYAYFDAAYWDSLYEQSIVNAGAHGTIALVQQYKNDIRTKINPIYFGEQSFLTRIQSGVSNLKAVPVEDLHWYREIEITKLLADGTEIVLEELENRHNAWIFYRDTDFNLHVYSGAAAEEFITSFDADVNKRSKIQGKTANGSGRIVGKVRLITRNYGDDPTAMQRAMQSMEKGEIVISETTDPDLIEALQKAAAIITDTGGMLSHAAITSRELKIPCIVGTGEATKIFNTGDLVEVDAEKGIVRVLEKHGV